MRVNVAGSWYPGSEVVSGNDGTYCYYYIISKKTLDKMPLQELTHFIPTPMFQGTMLAFRTSLVGRSHQTSIIFLRRTHSTGKQIYIYIFIYTHV